VDVVVASSAKDASAVEAVKAHHAQLAGALSVRVEALLSAVGRLAGDGNDAVERERSSLVAFCTSELLPHAAAEESAMYPAATALDEGRLLVEAMVAEHRVLQDLVEQVRAGASPVRVAAAAFALRSLFETHLAKENDLILPLLAAEPRVSVAELLNGMHELLGADDDRDDEHEHGHVEADQVSGGCGGNCGCGGDQSASTVGPELDLRAVPHAIRHATAFGAVGAVASGGSIVLVAPHDPLPLLGQIEEREPGAFAISYQERGPEAWRVRLSRV
jgi:uncharacterized protein (DUF2249 family)